MSKKTPSLLKRDEHGQIADRGEAKQVTEDLVEKFLTEHRAHEKEESFHVVKTGRRDIIVHLAVTIRPRVNGKTVIGEKEREYGQWYFEFPAKALPVSNKTAITAFAELAHVGKSVLMAMGLVRP